MELLKKSNVFLFIQYWRKIKRLRFEVLVRIGVFFFNYLFNLLVEIRIFMLVRIRIKSWTTDWGSTNSNVALKYHGHQGSEYFNLTGGLWSNYLQTKNSPIKRLAHKLFFRLQTLTIAFQPLANEERVDVRYTLYRFKSFICCFFLLGCNLNGKI